MLIFAGSWGGVDMQAELTSRECKVTLFEGRFAGNDKTCLPAVKEFWTHIIKLLAENGISTVGKLNQADPEKQRDLFFLDTLDKALYRQSDLVFRLRREASSKADWEVTLKFRHGDRLLAGAQVFRASKKDKVKFEEDVKIVISSDAPRFWALFSRSAEAQVRDAETLKTVGDCLALYEKLPKKSLPLGDTPVSRVNGLTVREHVFEGGYLELDDDVEAECAMILWWKQGEPDAPVAAEFSFRFDLDKNGEAESKVVRTAWKVLAALVQSPWVNPKGKTKTALAYGDADV